MRLFYFLLFIPAFAFAAAPNCDETDLIAGTVGCTSLTIDNAMNLTGTGGAPLDISVNGNVDITANIILDGANGTSLTADNTPGVNGGPGGFSGGGISSNAGEPGQVVIQGGLPGQVEAPCSAGGGGGASQMTNGNPGAVCSAGTLDGPAGTAPQDFPGVLSGGNGGGAGGEQNLGGFFDLGGGGGGGGGIRIHAVGGTITIANGVLISAHGGKGGNSVNIGGAGGGGGGGTIHLIGDLSVVNNGILDVTAGSGGLARTIAPRGGVGGAGGSGIIRIEIMGTPTDYTGRQDFSTGSPTSGSNSLSSSISCASLAKNDQNNLAFQMSLGFLMTFLFSIIIKFKSYFSISK